jgi:hypothetical protein
MEYRTMQTTTSSATAGGSRLSTVRRLYVYLVAFVSLTASLGALTSLIDVLARSWLDSSQGPGVGDDYYVRTIASSAGFLLVAVPLFLIHWWLAQRQSKDADEINSPLRKLFLYAAAAMSLGYLLVTTYMLIEGLAQVVLGAPLTFTSLETDWLSWVLVGALNAALVSYWAHVLRADGDFGAEQRGPAIVRQLYLAILGWIGLLVVLWGASSLLAWLLERLLAWGQPGEYGFAWYQALPSILGQFMVGGWLLHAVYAQWRELLRVRPGEGSAAVRRLYLYVIVFIGAVTTLTPTALVVRDLLLRLLGGGLDTGRLLDDLVTPLSLIPVGLAIWLTAWRIIQREADAYGESAQAATVRRLYFYLVAGVGLALTWVGAVQLLNALIDALLRSTPDALGAVWHQPLANGVSLLAVGAPVWALHWQAVQRVARSTEAAGRAERTALFRRIYLYGFALVSALFVLFELSQVIYNGLLWLLGEADRGLNAMSVASQLANATVAGLLWAVHLLAIRGDMQMERAHAGEEVAPAIAQPLTPEERRVALEQRIAALTTELEAARAELEGMLGEGVSG